MTKGAAGGWMRSKTTLKRSPKAIIPETKYVRRYERKSGMTRIMPLF